MREIKFRAWDKREKKYHNTHVAMSNDGVLRFNPDSGKWFDTSFIPEQYTGLKDINGVDIYEGDLVKYKHPNVIDYSTNHKGEIEICKIEYIEDYVSFRAVSKEGFENPIHGDIVIEIIGNIHENPELLKEV